jgi:hypothetical protein
MSDFERSPTQEIPLGEVRLALREIMQILEKDSEGYENQRGRIRELAQRCLDIVEERS